VRFSEDDEPGQRPKREFANDKIMLGTRLNTRDFNLRMRLAKRERACGSSEIDSNFTRVSSRLIPEGNLMSLADAHKESSHARKK
jgi:hypothetical protein